MGADLWLILLGYAAAGAMGYLGFRAGALSRSGGVAACMVGGTIFGFGGLAWAALLVLRSLVPWAGLHGLPVGYALCSARAAARLQRLAPPGGLNRAAQLAA
ncbi:MAG TPA: hypothetical protein VEX13_02380, partial [Chloroflexia bacterium]|nr:hypothetical protein [Chloroflexia bacterium]